MATVERPAQGRLGMLALEEGDAWQQYLDDTKDQPVHRYDDLEPWAWARLGRKLGDIEARRAAIENEDDGA